VRQSKNTPYTDAFWGSLLAWQEDLWLDPDAELAHLLRLLKPYDSAAMEYYPVSRAVNSPSHNAPDCIVPI
jgi:putative SOS response-associated peptidase YedK